MPRRRWSSRPTNAVHERHAIRDLLERARRQPLQERDAAPEAGLEVQLAAHRRLRDGRHLVSHTGGSRQLVDHLGLYERGVLSNATSRASGPISAAEPRARR